MRSSNILKYLFPIFLISLSSSWARERNCWSLEPIYEGWTQTGVVPVDLKGNGKDWILDCQGPSAFVRDQTGVITGQFNFPTKRILPLGAFALSGRPYKEAVFSYNTGAIGDSVWLAFVDSAGIKKHLAFIGEDLRPVGEPHYDGTIARATVLDVNGDGTNDLVCFAQTAFDKYPRGILVYDYKNDRELWHFWMGCSPINVAFLDVNGDGQEELIVGTFGPSNGADTNGLDDSHSYVVSLDREGRLLWKREIGGATTVAQTWAGDLKGDGRQEIVVCEVQGLAGKEKPNRLLLLEPRTGEVIKYREAGEQFWGMRVCDFNRDGRLEIVTDNTDGVVRVFNADLEVIKERRFETGTWLQDAQDLDGDGKNEAIFVAKDNRLLILDEQLNTICEYRPEKGEVMGALLARDGRRNNVIAFKRASSEGAIYTVLRVHQASPLKALSSERYILLAVLALSLGLLALFWDKLRYRQMVRDLVDATPLGVIVLKGRNKLFYVNYLAHKFLGETRGELMKFIWTPEVREWLTAPREPKRFSLTHEHGGQISHLQVELHRVGTRKLIVLFDNSSETTTRELLAWGSLAQRLAHEIKNPLSTINLTLQRLREVCKAKLGGEAGAVDHYADSIQEEIERLRNTTDGFMKILSLGKPEPAPNDIHLLLEQALQKYEGSQPPEIQVKKSLAKDLPLIQCDGSQVLIALSNVFENALEAMEGKGVLTVRTALAERLDPAKGSIKRYVEVRVEDTGKGIPEETLKNLCQPFYSTKPGGTGLGLIIAKRIVEEHSGSLRLESKPGLGTVVTIEMPVEAQNPKS